MNYENMNIVNRDWAEHTMLVIRNLWQQANLTENYSEICSKYFKLAAWCCYILETMISQRKQFIRLKMAHYNFNILSDM